ncbi:hypothetical protein VOLCADRAFT_89178 [Volvox carteri f. nagariensis]|uniref:Uncharacterized protein n=1 Tax=Volvox carteri f. nagariensis TaxID=3068 RepID=D8TR03_VOLCA|nr:uncharacterized protein VOLCADRAFT_89178 [Volvox carteri f. nagariensis]EFJ50251.1 hypothetical protein VOLCADRAFT_89178 [Volvox carteri f. nagariensis]|eukprot:XP_002948871.1 hypothetical protein VOLCADRAFT_89178 [Volvox carteri f. nagariensis]
MCTKRRLPPSATAVLKHAGLPRKISLGAVAEQLDDVAPGMDWEDLPPTPGLPPTPADPKTPPSVSTILTPASPSLAYAGSAGSFQSPLSPLSAHVASLRECWSKKTVAGRTQDPVALPTVDGSDFEPGASALGEGLSPQQELERIGRVGAMVALFDDATRLSDGSSVSFCTTPSQSPLQPDHTRASTPASTTGGTPQSGRRLHVQPPTTATRANNASSMAPSSGPYRLGPSSSNRNSKFVCQPTNISAVTSQHSPRGKKIVNSSALARAAAAASGAAAPFGKMRGQLRRPVCRYSIDSVCSDIIPSTRPISTSQLLREQPDTSPPRRSEQRSLFKQLPRTPITPPVLYSPADTLPLLRSPCLPSPGALFSPLKPLPQPLPLCGMDDVMPMASPIPSAIDRSRASLAPADSGVAVLGARERRRRLRLEESFLSPMAESSQLLSAGAMHAGEIPTRRRALTAVKSQRGMGGDASGASDAEDEFGLPAWAWRSVAVLMSQNTEANGQHEQLPQPASEAGRQSQLQGYAQDDPSLVPLRRLSGTPHRWRGQSAATPAAQLLPAAAGMRLAAATAVPGEPSNCLRYQCRPTSPGEDVDVDEGHTAVLLSLHAARGRYSPKSTMTFTPVASDYAVGAAASSAHSSDSDEPSAPLPVHDGAGGWEQDAGILTSPGARLLPFSGTHIDALVFESLGISCTEHGLAELKMRESDEGGHAVALAAPTPATAQYQLADNIVAPLVVEVPAGPTKDSCSDSASKSSFELHCHPGQDAVASPRLTAAGVVIKDTGEAACLLGSIAMKDVWRNEDTSAPKIVELPHVIAALAAAKSVFNSPRASRALCNPQTSVAAIADKAALGHTLGAAVCAAGAMAVAATAKTLARTPLFAVAGVAAAVLLASKALLRRGRRRKGRRSLVAAQLSVGGLGNCGLGASIAVGALPQTLRLSSSASATASLEVQSMGQCPDSPGRSGDLVLRISRDGKDAADGKRGSRSVANSHVASPADVTVGLPSPDASSLLAAARPRTEENRRALLRIAAEAVDTCSIALSAMRVAGSDRAAMRRLAKACGVYAGMQMAATGNGQPEVVDPTSADWSAVQELVCRRLSRPRRPAAPWPATPTIPEASECAAAAVVPAAQCRVAGQPALAPCSTAAVEMGPSPVAGASCLSISEHHASVTEADGQLGLHPEAASSDSVMALSDCSVPQQCPEVNPLGVVFGVKSTSRAARASVEAALSAQEKLLMLMSKASADAGASSVKLPSAVRHCGAGLAAAAAEAAAVALVAVRKSISGEGALSKLADTHCILSGDTSLSDSGSSSATASSADKACVFATESSSALEALAQLCRTGHAAFALAASTCSSISALAAAAETAALEALAIHREEALAIYATALAEESEISVHASSAEDIAYQELWEARRAPERLAIEMASAAAAQLAEAGEEDAMKVLGARREQQLQEVAQVIASNVTLAARVDSACARAMPAHWSQPQQLLGCIAYEEATGADVPVCCPTYEEAAMTTYATDRQELLSRVSLAAACHAAEEAEGSAAAAAAVQELLRDRALKLHVVSEAAAADSAVRVLAETQEEAALARLVRARTVLVGVCFAVEAMDAATALRACVAESAALKALYRRRLRCKAAYAGVAAATAAAAAAAIAAEEEALEQFAFWRQRRLADDKDAVVPSVQLSAGAPETGNKVHDQPQTLVTRNIVNEATSAVVAMQAASSGEGTWWALADEGVQAGGVDAAVSTSDLADTVAAGQAWCMLGFLQLQKQQLSLYATALGTTMAAIAAAASAKSSECVAEGSGCGLGGSGVNGAGGKVVRMQGSGENRPVCRPFPVRCFPLHSLGGDGVEEAEEAADVVSRVTSFPVRFSDDESTDEELSEESDVYM